VTKLTLIWRAQSLAPGITLTRSIYGYNKINKRVRGIPIKDLKLGRKGGKGGSQSIYAYGLIISLVLSYTPLRTYISIYNYLTLRPYNYARNTTPPNK
jgi:hypothetical protein